MHFHRVTDHLSGRGWGVAGRMEREEMEMIMQERQVAGREVRLH